jgi:hypothetical protein
MARLSSSSTDDRAGRPYQMTSPFRLPTSDFRVPTSDFRLPTSDFRLPRSDFRVSRVGVTLSGIIPLPRFAAVRFLPTHPPLPAAGPVVLATALLVAGFAAGAWAQQAEAPVTATAGKKAKQIRVAAEEAPVRSAFGLFADGLRDEFGAVFGENDEAWVFPVELRVSGSAKDVVEGGTTAIPPIELLPSGQFQLQLAVRLHTRYDSAEVRRELLRVLLYEMMLRPFAANPDAFAGQSLDVPPWLLRGLDELMRHRASGRPSDLYAGIVNSREILSVAKILRQTEERSDPVTDSIFAASSAALLAALLAQEGGQAGIRGFLGNLPQEPDPDQEAMLRAHFPSLRGSRGALEKWWSLEIASMGQLQATEFYPPGQTVTMLEEALSIRLAAGQAKPADGIRKFLPQGKPDEAFTGRVHDFDRVLSHEGGKAALEQCRSQLKALSLRAFPLYRSLLLRYELAVARLIEGKTRGIDEDLKKLDAERDAIGQTLEKVADSLNFYEATQAEGRNEAYEQYRRVKEQLERQGRPPREDRISKYLDALEAEFAKP